MKTDSIFERFGGVPEMARLIGEPPSNVRDWKIARRIPAGDKQRKVLRRARELGLQLTGEDVVFPFPEDRALT